MAHDAKIQARARALHEVESLSFDEIAERLDVGRRSVARWAENGMPDAKEGRWIKGRMAMERHQREQEKTLEEAGKMGITKARVLEELALVGFADMADFVSVQAGGGIQAIPFDAIADGKTRILKKVREKRTIRQSPDKSGDILLDQTYEFELHDKLGALTKLGQHLGLFKDEIRDDRYAGVLDWIRRQ